MTEKRGEFPNFSDCEYFSSKPATLAFLKVTDGLLHDRFGGEGGQKIPNNW